MTGAGRGFCAGADMQRHFKTRLDGIDPGGDSERTGGMPAEVDWVSLARDSKPLIAAVNGAAVGIGMTMILPFDVIVASEQAKFGMLFIKVGLVPELASSQAAGAARRASARRARCASAGGLVDGAEAHRMGLAERLTAPTSCSTRRSRVAGEIAANPAPQLRMIKRLLTENALEDRPRLGAGP